MQCVSRTHEKRALCRTLGLCWPRQSAAKGVLRAHLAPLGGIQAFLEASSLEDGPSVPPPLSHSLGACSLDPCERFIVVSQCDTSA